MGWFDEDGNHEGYLVGLIESESGGFLGRAPQRLRELSGSDELMIAALPYVKVACDCGWRSPLLRAPAGCDFAPSSVFAPRWFEDACAELWKRHARESGQALDGGYEIRSLLHHAGIGLTR